MYRRKSWRALEMEGEVPASRPGDACDACADETTVLAPRKVNVLTEAARTNGLWQWELDSTGTCRTCPALPCPAPFAWTHAHLEAQPSPSPPTSPPGPPPLISPLFSLSANNRCPKRPDASISLNHVGRSDVSSIVLHSK